MPMGLPQKNKLVIYSTTYAGWGGTHPLPVDAVLMLIGWFSGRFKNSGDESGLTLHPRK